MSILFDMCFEQVKNFLGIIYYDLEFQACDTGITGLKFLLQIH